MYDIILNEKIERKKAQKMEHLSRKNTRPVA